MKNDILKDLNSSKIDEYRSIPFWSWNDELEIPELQWQIRWMKEQGFGGYFMHARGGLTTEYLSEKWFDCIKACADEGERLGLQSWAYDENGWPSGFVGGKLLENPENCDKYLTYAVGEFDITALVSYLITENTLVRANTKDDKGEYLNIYEHTSVSNADVLNPDVVKQFIDQTHEKYKTEFGENFSKRLSGFFTDEPQYQRWHHPYTKMLPKYFKEVYNQDILDGLGLMFLDKDGYQDFRYKYWKAMQTLMVDGFAKLVYSWCDKNGQMLTGHYVEEPSLEFQVVCCGGIMPFYEYEHIPGIDKLGRDIPTPVAPKQVSSVATQLNKKKVLTETYACCGWNVTPRTLKIIAESQYVNGVNLMCQHLLPYSEHGQRKRDYPAHFSWANPWVRKDFKSFNDYFARLSYLLAESKEKVNVAVFCPIRSIYFDYKRDKFMQRIPYDVSYQELCVKLSKMNIPYHIVDETIMANHGSVNNDKLVVGSCEYEYIIFPKTLTMDVSSEKLFTKFYRNGGKFLFTDGVPTCLEGTPHTYDYATNVGFDEIVASQEIKINNYETGVQSAVRELDGAEFIFAVNTDENESYTVTFNGDFNSFDALDLETLKVTKKSKTVTFNGGDSFVLFLSKENAPDCESKICDRICFDGGFEVVKTSGNYLTLDKLAYSLDGETYSEPLRYMGVFNELLNKRYNGNVYLKYSFDIEEVPSNISFLSENMRNVWCKVNGVDIEFTGESDFEKKIYKADISKLVKKGKNEAVIKINFYESDNVYYVLFGENVTESLKNCLAYDTTIEACYLQGDFGVYSKSGFTNGKAKNSLIGNDFYISTPKTQIDDTIKDGYPFFAGDMTLKKTFTSNGEPLILDLNGDFCLCDILINGKRVEKSYFAKSVDISSYVVKGENTAIITLYSGNRNLLGPFHLSEENPEGVGPYSYELNGTWTNGVSSKERKEYSFMRFGLFK